MKGVVYVGCSGFPIGMAQIQRQLNIAKALELAGYHVTVCSRKGVHSKTNNQTKGISAKGVFQGIRYVYSSGTPFYNSSFLKRNILKVKGTLGELFHIVGRRINGNAKFLLVNTISLADLSFYYWLTRLLGMKLVYDYVEQVGQLKTSSGINKQFDDRLTKYSDRIICISDLLQTSVLKRNPQLPTLKIPALTSFDEIEKVVVKQQTIVPYFLYCGAAGYHEVICFIIDAFELLETNTMQLHLVVHGGSAEMEIVSNRIEESPKRDEIKVFSGLPYNELVVKYKGASALLIPLRDNVLDKARFPHKISEYVATGNPIISSPVGEVDNYFEDGKTALIAKDLSVKAFAEKMMLTQKRTRFCRQGWV